jgi:hypothetical protein
VYYSRDEELKSDGCEVAVGEFMLVSWTDDAADVVLGIEDPL